MQLNVFVLGQRVIKTKKILFWTLVVIMTAPLISAGWYLVKLTATSPYKDNEWLTDSHGRTPIFSKAVDEKTV